MERQKKLWSEMTEEEQQAIRDSWKHTLPEEFDVFCIGNLIYEESDGDLNIPGNLYVSGYADIFDLSVNGTAIIGKSIDSAAITVRGGSFLCGGKIIAGDVSISDGDFICDGEVDAQDITIVNGNCTVQDSINSYAINIDGFLNCYDVDPNGCKVNVTDFICQCCHENI